MVKAAYKLKNDKSEIVIWDDTGKGKSYPLTLQSLKLIKK
jgi:predicted transcriptional regulator